MEGETPEDNAYTRWFAAAGPPLRLLRVEPGPDPRPLPPPSPAEVVPAPAPAPVAVADRAGPPSPPDPARFRRVGIVGSRDYEPMGFVAEYVARLAAAPSRLPLCIVSGTEPPPATAARRRPDGVDEAAIRAARGLGLATHVYPADWDGPLGRGAGFARNIAIVAGSDDVVAFFSGWSAGTADSILKAHRRGNLRAVYGTGGRRLDLDEAVEQAARARDRAAARSRARNKSG
jgi:hypothetical protein